MKINVKMLFLRYLRNNNGVISMCMLINNL